MKYLLSLLLLISVSATAQYSPTATKTRFVNGIGLGTKDTATMNAADTAAMIVGRDSLVYFRYKGYWKPLAYNSSLTGYVPYTGATGSVNLGSYNLTATSIIKTGGTSAQFLKADGSVTTTIPSGSIDTGRAVTAIATGGSLNKVRDSLQANIGLKLNISDTATMLSSYYNKTATDSRLALKVNYTDTATMLSGYKTYYPRAALSAGTGITYNASTGVITNSSPSTGGTVTSVATNTGSGITGGTITTSGTIAADTSVLSTKANVTASLLSKVSSVSGTSPIASSGGLTPTISISQSSGSTNGYLSSTDWTTFNNKQSALTNPVTGSGTTNYLPKFTGTSTIGNSLVYDNGTNVGIGTTSPSYLLDVNGTGRFSGALTGASGSKFTGDFTITTATNGQLYINHTNTSGVRENDIYFQEAGTNKALIRNNVGGNPFEFYSYEYGFYALTIASTGAATFSSSVTAGGFNVGEVSITSNQIYRNSANEFYVNYSGTGNTILGNGTGNVSINAGTNPAYRLDVGGTGRFSGNSNSVIDILTLNNYSATSAGVRQIFNNGFGNLAAIKAIQMDNGALADDGQLEFQTAQNSVLGTRLTITNSGAATFSSTISVGGGAFGVYQDPQISVRKDSNAPISIHLSNQANNASATAYYSAGAYGNSWYWGVGSSTSSYGNDFVLRTDISTSNAPILRIATSGAATFSSSVTAGGIFNTFQYFKVDVNNWVTNGESPTLSSFTSGTELTRIFTTAENVGGYAGWGVKTLRAGADGLATRLYITSQGNVGIGTTSPNSLLEVYGQTRVSASGGSVFLITPDATSTNGITLESSYYASAGYGPMKFNTGGSERIRITSGGNVLIGTTTDAGYKLDVNGTGRFSGALTVNGTRPILTDGSGGNIFIQGESGGWAVQYGFRGNGGTNRGGFGALGGTNDLSYWFIGKAYNDNALSLDYSTGAATFSSTIKTGIPATWSAAGAWKLGTYFATTVALNTTGYITVDIGGTLYYLALASPL